MTMETITLNKAMEYANQLVSDRRITRQEASKYIMKNYRVLGGMSGKRELTSPYAIAVKLARVSPLTKKERSIVAQSNNLIGNINKTNSSRKSRNMDAYHLRRDIRGVLSMSLSDNVKLLIIKEMTA